MLSLTFIPEDGTHGELKVSAAYAEYSGTSSAWFNTADIRQFATNLRALADNRAEFAEMSGRSYSDDAISTQPVETHVGIRVARHGPKGRFFADVSLADPGDGILPQSAWIRFEVEWAALFGGAESIEMMLTSGGEARLLSSYTAKSDPDVFAARYPVLRPYTPLFMQLRETCNALIERMEREVAVKDGAAVEPHTILAHVDWAGGRVTLVWETDGDDITRAPWSTEYVLDLLDLKHFAQAMGRPRACFDSYVLLILNTAESYLIEFYRDGPTDDIPFKRHHIYGLGIAGAADAVWVGDVVFNYLEVRA